MVPLWANLNIMNNKTYYALFTRGETVKMVELTKVVFTMLPIKSEPAYYLCS